MDVLSLNQRFIRELLDLYHKLPAVWKIKCPEYKNKVAKARAYDLLVQKCKEYVPDADREFVKNKINSLRTSFRKELRKVQASQTKAEDISEIYVPNLWYYNMLTFTADQESPTNTITQNTSNNIAKNDVTCIFDEDISNQDEDGFFDLKSEPKSPRMLEEQDPLSPTIIEPPPKKKPRLETMVTTSIPATVPDDVFDAIGKNVAHKLRGMSQQQRIIAEKIISDVMYHGQMETLTVNAELTLP